MKKLFLTLGDIGGITMAKKKNEEEIGFHKGALSTLAKERDEFQRILSIVEQLMHMHIKALKEAGVDLETEAKKKGKKALEESL